MRSRKAKSSISGCNHMETIIMKKTSVWWQPNSRNRKWKVAPWWWKLLMRRHKEKSKQTSKIDQIPCWTLVDSFSLPGCEPFGFCTRLNNWCYIIYSFNNFLWTYKPLTMLQTWFQIFRGHFYASFLHFNER